MELRHRAPSERLDQPVPFSERLADREVCCGETERDACETPASLRLRMFAITVAFRARKSVSSVSEVKRRMYSLLLGSHDCGLVPHISG